MKFEILENKSGKYSFRHHKKGRIKFDSQAYTTLGSCKRALRSVMEDISKTKFVSGEIIHLTDVPIVKNKPRQTRRRKK